MLFLTILFFVDYHFMGVSSRALVMFFYLLRDITQSLFINLNTLIIVGLIDQVRSSIQGRVHSLTHSASIVLIPLFYVSHGQHLFTAWFLKLGRLFDLGQFPGKRTN